MFRRLFRSARAGTGRRRGGGPSTPGGANPVWSRLATGEAGRSSGVIQRQADGDVTEGTSCACDCESYCEDVARRYADEHIHYPDWTGSGNPTKIPVTILESTCEYSTKGPCDFVCWVKARDEASETLFWIIVLLYGGSRFHVTTSTGLYDACTYDVHCGKAGLELIPAGCQSPE